MLVNFYLYLNAAHMKKNALTILFVSSLLNGFAQTEPLFRTNQKVEYGLQTGLNLNSITAENTIEKQGILPGLNIGAHLKVNASKHFGLKVILQYEQRGYMFKDLIVEYPGNRIGKADILSRQNYIDLKALPTLTVGNYRTFYLYAGPTLGVLVSNKLITKFKDSLPPGNQSSVKTNAVKKKPINVGVAIGIGTQIPIAPSIQLCFDVRSDLGLTNIYKSGNGKLRTFSFSPGINISL
ncbi:MAG: PorT family protein [Chitinophagaceae bacterium]|nr:MAG: PorT family protein [Chitinophagaceae bacterium]